MSRQCLEHLGVQRTMGKRTAAALTSICKRYGNTVERIHPGHTNFTLSLTLTASRRSWQLPTTTGSCAYWPATCRTALHTAHITITTVPAPRLPLAQHTLSTLCNPGSARRLSLSEPWPR